MEAAQNTLGHSVTASEGITTTSWLTQGGHLSAGLALGLLKREDREVAARAKADTAVVKVENNHVLSFQSVNTTIFILKIFLNIQVKLLH